MSEYSTDSENIECLTPTALTWFWQEQKHKA